jgi:hypothetical protein
LGIGDTQNARNPMSNRSLPSSQFNAPRPSKFKFNSWFNSVQSVIPPDIGAVFLLSMQWLNNLQDILRPDVERTKEEDKDSSQPSPQSGRRPGDDGTGPRHRFGINLERSFLPP